MNEQWTRDQWSIYTSMTLGVGLGSVFTVSSLMLGAALWAAAITGALFLLAGGVLTVQFMRHAARGEV